MFKQQSKGTYTGFSYANHLIAVAWYLSNRHRSDQIWGSTIFFFFFFLGFLEMGKLGTKQSSEFCCAPCSRMTSVRHRWLVRTSWTAACQACASWCPQPDWLMGRIIHLSWHSSLLSSLISLGTSSNITLLLPLCPPTHTHTQTHCTVCTAKFRLADAPQLLYI